MTSKSKSRGAPAPLVGLKIPVKIEKMAIGGAGVARHEGMVIFVPQAAPNEELLIEITLVKKNFAEGKIVEILSPSPFRHQALCPVADRCGGCNWQHITEDEQRRQKHSLVSEIIQKFNRNLEFEYLPLVSSPRSFRYRNRIQPKFKSSQFGFFERNSHRIVPITDCLITEKALTDKFAEVKNWAEKQNSKELLRLEMYIADDNQVRYGKITDDDDGVGFSQVNRFQNEDLLQTALSWAGTGPYTKIFDLYAGAGNFTFPLAKHYLNTPVEAVELNSKLVKKGKANSGNLPISFIQSDVEKYMETAQIGKNDLVVLDPPRAGASETIIRKLVASQPRKLIYISCHPVSLARDLQWFFDESAKRGLKYSLKRVQTFEMFPQTDHVETIAELILDSE